MAKTLRLTTAQAIVRFLKAQTIERDGKKQAFFAGMWGIFGHGNVAGLGQALEEDRDFPYFQARNEQGMVHAAVAYAKQQRRLRAFSCTSSIGPGATNMLTAAAGATINRLPVLLLPGDYFARRTPGPVLQQLEHPLGPEQSVNDCFRPISRFWDRIYRPEQLLYSLPEAVRVLTSPSETGAVTLALPQDVQAEAFNYPSSFFAERSYVVDRPLPAETALVRAVELIRQARRPMLVVGGGVLYAEAEEALAQFAACTCIPVGETQAGKGSLPWDHPQNLGAVGATGTKAANLWAQKADLIVAVGTRLADFTTASGTQFAHEKVQFIAINLTAADAHKYQALPLLGDAKLTLGDLSRRLQAHSYQLGYGEGLDVKRLKDEWLRERQRIVELEAGPRISQGEVIALVNAELTRADTVVAAAGGLPGDMHKLMHVETASQYHMEYGYSCMGYEIAGGLGARMAKAQGEVFVMVGDGSYLMMHTEIVTSLQEGQKLIIVLLVNHKFACIDRLSRSCGSQGFGNEFRARGRDGQLDGDLLGIDYASNASSLGAKAIQVHDRKGLQEALAAARLAEKTTVIVVDVDPDCSVPSYESRWEVAVAEVSTLASVQAARQDYVQKFVKVETT